jgi:hypothetical protein
MNYEDLTTEATPSDHHKHTWKYREVMEYPDPIRPRQERQPLRLRAVGVRSDGQLYQVIGSISSLALAYQPDTRRRVEDNMLQKLDSYLIDVGYVESEAIR